MVKLTKSGTQNSITPVFGGLFCTTIVILVSILIQARDSPPLNEYLSKKIPSTKPYATFDEFYSRYLREHCQKITRQ